MSESGVTNLKDLYGENKKITNGNYDKTLAVRCINGTFVGQRRENIIAYKGIPFVGRQPVDDLRWKAPVDYTSDDGVYEAFYIGKTPCQPEGDVAAEYVMGEDCLYLNIWKADDASGEKKPVMVWIYGGAFETGGTADPNYEGHNFIAENPDVIFVTIAYRIGVLGFFHLSHLADGGDYTDSQNLGLLDQMMALKCVSFRQCSIIRRISALREGCLTGNSGRPCVRCGYSLQRPGILRFPRTFLLTDGHTSGRYTTRRTEE